MLLRYPAPVEVGILDRVRRSDHTGTTKRHVVDVFVDAGLHGVVPVCIAFDLQVTELVIFNRSERDYPAQAHKLGVGVFVLQGERVVTKPEPAVDAEAFVFGKELAAVNSKLGVQAGVVVGVLGQGLGAVAHLAVGMAELTAQKANGMAATGAEQQGFVDAAVKVNGVAPGVETGVQLGVQLEGLLDFGLDQIGALAVVVEHAAFVEVVGLVDFYVVAGRSQGPGPQVKAKLGTECDRGIPYPVFGGDTGAHAGAEGKARFPGWAKTALKVPLGLFVIKHGVAGKAAAYLVGLVVTQGDALAQYRQALVNQGELGLPVAAGGLMGPAGYLQDAVPLVPVIKVVLPPDMQGAIFTGGAYVLVAFVDQLLANALGRGPGWSIFRGGGLWLCCGGDGLLRHWFESLFAGRTAKGDRHAHRHKVAVFIAVAVIPGQHLAFYLHVPGQPAARCAGTHAHPGVLTVVLDDQVEPGQRAVADRAKGAIQVTAGVLRPAIANRQLHGAKLFAGHQVIGFEVAGFAAQVLYAGGEGKPVLRDKRCLHFYVGREVADFAIVYVAVVLGGVPHHPAADFNKGEDTKGATDVVVVAVTFVTAPADKGLI